MAALSESDRVEIWAAFMRQNDELSTTEKAALRAAVDATDTWVDANAAAFNQALPQPARGALTGRQKARLLMLVVNKRFQVT